MKNLKSILALFAAVLLMSATTYAQRPSSQGADRGNRLIEMMTQELGLSEVQAEQIKTIQTEYTESMRAMRSGSNGDRDAMRAAMQKAVADREAAISNVLTEEQRTKWAAKKADRPERGQRPSKGMDGKRPAMNGGKGSLDGSKRPRGVRNSSKANKLQKELGLSDDQAKELKTLTKAHQADIKALKADGKTRKIKKAHKKHRAAVKKILTEEQFEKWTAMKTERRGARK